jgi:23S rRNA maturation-related 3'-5' exoribonuclease YhaM
MQKKHDAKLGKEILEYFSSEIEITPASSSHHLNFKGGLLRHLNNVNDIVNEYFRNDKDYDSLSFLALIHDIGKARVYEVTTFSVRYKQPSIDHLIHTIEMLHEYGVTLYPDELNALQFHHGGWSKFDGKMTELAVKLHFCDHLATVRESNGESKL